MKGEALLSVRHEEQHYVNSPTGNRVLLTT